MAAAAAVVTVAVVVVVAVALAVATSIFGLEVWKAVLSELVLQLLHLFVPAASPQRSRCR